MKNIYVVVRDSDDMLDSSRIESHHTTRESARTQMRETADELSSMPLSETPEFESEDAVSVNCGGTTVTLTVETRDVQS